MNKLNKVVKRLCNLFGLYIVMSLRNGEVKIERVCGGSLRSAYIKYIKRTLRYKKVNKELLFFTHAGCNHKLRKKIVRECKKYQKFEHIVEQQAAAAITCNCGVGCFGLIYTTGSDNDIITKIQP